MKDNKTTPAPSWKGCIVFGIINTIFVILCTKLNILLVSASMILLLVVGIVVSVQSVKEDYLSGFKASAFGCLIGFLLQCFACVLYAYNLLSGIVALFVR